MCVFVSAVARTNSEFKLFSLTKTEKEKGNQREQHKFIALFCFPARLLRRQHRETSRHQKITKQTDKHFRVGRVLLFLFTRQSIKKKKIGYENNLIGMVLCVLSLFSPLSRSLALYSVPLFYPREEKKTALSFITRLRGWRGATRYVIMINNALLYPLYKSSLSASFFLFFSFPLYTPCASVRHARTHTDTYSGTVVYKVQSCNIHYTLIVSPTSH